MTPAKYSKVKTPEGKTRTYLREDARLMRLVDKGQKLFHLKEQIDDQFKAIKEMLIEEAKLRLGTVQGQTVHLNSLKNRATVSFPNKTSFDNAQLIRAKVMMLDLEIEDNFDDLFKTKVTFSPTKELDGFLSQMGGEKIGKVQEAINRSIVIEPGTPTIRFAELDKK
jgi:tRNA U34 5-carboxymethylaminomethyl modifying enzyme MnmG/GidA